MLKLTVGLALVTLVACLQCSNNDVCEAGQTCCQAPSGDTSCCPLHHGECCEDHLHCCPEGMLCQVKDSMCQNATHSLPWAERLHVEQTSLPKDSNVPCDDTAACPDESTCCKTKDGGWACCPLPEAVCCDDFVHCCPHGPKCNMASEKCEDPSGSMPWFEKIPVRPISSLNSTDTQVSSTSDVPCDDTVACPDGSTCCKTKEGGWACCPLSEAVCCDDFVHCCPHGTKCNLAAETCDDPSGSMPWFEKMPVRPISNQNSTDTQVSSTSDVPCDDTVACPDGSTCCKTKEGEWACCPLPEAVCCEDFVHCCPHGQKCNLAAQSCDDPSGSVPWFEKLPTRPREGLGSHENMSCDSSHSCPESNTCCKNIDGDWNCCPMPEAVCCKDGDHCCPAGYECDVIKVTCVKKDAVIPWYKKIPAKSTPAPSSDLGDVKCDDQTSCETGSTCCRLSTGDWGCCPLPEAVCCPDHEHCCPKGYTCDAGGSCMQNTWLQVDRVPLIHTGGKEQQPISSVKDIQCADGHSCLDSETCCKTSETTWACCPSPKAVCCDDMKHCCPAGYTCKDGVCSKPKGLKWNSWGY
nr:granulin a isoform X2 [Misgurnus anguillicaudatus]